VLSEKCSAKVLCARVLSEKPVSISACQRSAKAVRKEAKKLISRIAKIVPDGVDIKEN
jgi:intracellular sulfur oxidation DsrE/DsrF family protein